MKITTMTLHIHESDLTEYEDNLIKMGWEKVRQDIYRKNFGNTSVEIQERMPVFGTFVELVATFYNPNGCDIEEISKLLRELRDADETPDKD